MSTWLIIVLAAVGFGLFLLFLTWQSKRLDRRPWWRPRRSRRPDRSGGPASGPGLIADDPGGPPLGPDDSTE